MQACGYKPLGSFRWKELSASGRLRKASRSDNQFSRSGVFSCDLMLVQLVIRIGTRGIQKLHLILETACIHIF